ncbi:uncharacterized protein [Amphiura filiformis]|uniref:uncharacterized protein n=1 Tax=Amphiura filiformis TaxID=82378 RepID=UPI003B220F68
MTLGRWGWRECLDPGYACCLCEDEETGEKLPGKIHPDKFECMCPCYCDPPDNTVKSVKEKDGECECDTCPDGKTLKRKYLDPECYCNCADGTEREMNSDGTCPCDCTCADGSYDTIDESGECPCSCDCKDCTKSTLGPSRCMCDDICPPCEVNERQVWENCECHCKGDDECGIPPTCVLGRKGALCDAPDCFPCQGCSGNGVCSLIFGQCTSTCGCNIGWGGACCERRVPTGGGGDPHLKTLDGKTYDYFGIGEFVYCQSPDNGFGVHSRFFYHNNASLIGAVAVKAGDSVATITTPGTTVNDMPFLRIDGDLEEVRDKLKYTLGNSTVILDIEQPVANNTSDGVAVAFLSFQFKSARASLTLEVRHSNVMHRQYLNILLTPSVGFYEKTEGLCGFMDDDDSNDFQGPDEVTYTDAIEFAASWEIITSQLNPGIQGSWSWNQSNFHVNDTMDKSYTDPHYVPIYSLDHIPEEQRKVAEEICIALGIEGSLLQGCIYDVAVTNDTSFSEQETLKTGCPLQCNGKGRCVNSTCECLDGWSGEDCREGACGECVRGHCDERFCSCDIGWEGTICDVKASCLSVNNCTDPSKGRCLMTDICLCTPGYTGDDCSLIATCYNTLNCSDHGVCIDFDVCDCDYGWNGNFCDMPTCETFSYCSGNGDCVDHDKCNCFSGWKGSSCGMPDCTAVADCSRNGNCIAPDTCECYSEYVGSNCSVPLNCSHLNDCNGNGVCVFEESAEDLTCRCYLGYDGIDCSSLDCSEVNDCTGNGTCVEPNFCVCDLGFTGSECSVYSCETLGFCSGHGSCVEYDVCNCTEGWLGIFCDIPSCHDVNNCSDQGVCIARDLCECYNGYEGIACDEESLPNLATPVFLQSEYNTTIPEHTASGSIILTVQAILCH